MKIAIIGFGVVGSGAYETSRSVEGLEVVSILTKDFRPEYEYLKDRMVNSIDEIVNNPEIELVIEAIGGIDTPREFVLKCLNAGKHVVTPNKNLISACYDELVNCANANNVSLSFTPAAGGGIPWLFNLRRTRRSDKVTRVRGIVNGTCNYILDAMHESGASFDTMLKSAQELGYAERDPSSDIEGIDTLRKTVISANLAFDSHITEPEVNTFGIDSIDACDIAYFNEKGLTCRLMMNASLNEDEGVISAYVEPMLFKPDALEASVKTNNNLITLEGEHVGTLSFYGQGAGKMPTGQSVIQDVIDIKDGVNLCERSIENADYVVDNSKEIHTYYIRLENMNKHELHFIDSYEEKDGIFYCISKPMSVASMHKAARHVKEQEQKVFFASIA